MRFVEVRDPLGFRHRIEFVEGRAWGAENIAHCYDLPFTQQREIVGRILRALAHGDPLPAGYSVISITPS